MLGPISINTSGSTSKPKLVNHSNIEVHVQRSIDEIGLGPNDRVLNVYPSNVIANYTVTALPALLSGAHLYSTSFDPYSYINIFQEYQPTYISLLPRHHEILSKTKGWINLDMSCVRYMVTGSSNITQNLINEFRSKGVKLVANWYGMTEMPPPVFIGYNSSSFDFTPKSGYDVNFTDEGECVINGWHTGDVFNLVTKEFTKRKETDNNAFTWKNNF